MGIPKLVQNKLLYLMGLETALLLLYSIKIFIEEADIYYISHIISAFVLIFKYFMYPLVPVWILWFFRNKHPVVNIAFIISVVMLTVFIVNIHLSTAPLWWCHDHCHIMEFLHVH